MSAVEEISDGEGAWVAYEIMDKVVSNKYWFKEVRSLLSPMYSTRSPIGLRSNLGLSLDFTRTFFE